MVNYTGVSTSSAGCNCRPISKTSTWLANVKAFLAIAKMYFHFYKRMKRNKWNVYMRALLNETRNLMRIQPWI